MARRLVIALLIVAAAVVAVILASGPGGTTGTGAPAPAASALSGSSAPPTPASGPTGPPAAAARAAAAKRRPNIVFVLTDDLSMNLLRFMPQVQALEARGLTFDNYFVSDSLCCPSRSSIFTGNFPHDTGVYTNSGPDGGIGAFYANDDETHTFNVALQQAGYRTAMMGKYLNGYLQGPARSPVSDTYVPPGWSEWDVAGWGYPEFDYALNENETIHGFGSRPRAYLTDVLASRGVRFIDSAAKAHAPFFLELATFSPHSPYTPAPRDRRTFPGLKAPRPAAFDRLPTNAPAWLANHPRLSAGQVANINRVFRRRVQDIQSVDDLLTKVNVALQRHHLLGHTYVVFSSDNGFHTGEYRLAPGKLTAFDTDIHVPLVVAGPGVPADATTTAMSENIDLAKTFAGIGGTTVQCDGHSLKPLFGGRTPTGWRNAILVEHHHTTDTSAGPDAQTTISGNPPTYEAMRTPDYLYVEYDTGEREFYDLRTDPDELHNLASQLTPPQLTILHGELSRLQNCHSGGACWAAGHVTAQTAVAPLTGALRTHP